MANSRRNFIKTGTIAAVAAGISASLSGNASAKTVIGFLGAEDHLAKARFVRNLNTTFRVQAEGVQAAELKLISVTDLKQAAGSKREGFSLEFDGARGRHLPQHIYSIEHHDLGRFSLLMVPIVSRRRNQAHYEVIINKLYQ